jgi:hypothetical protein
LFCLRLRLLLHHHHRRRRRASLNRSFGRSVVSFCAASSFFVFGFVFVSLPLLLYRQSAVGVVYLTHQQQAVSFVATSRSRH